MRVLITGADGFIGSNALNYLLVNTGWDFVCLCSWRHFGNPLNIKPSRRVEVISHDLTGPIPEIGDFDYIINFASESHVDRSMKEPVAFVENNVSSTLQMLEYARKHVPKVFLQFSTDEVFGAMDHKEWDILLPSNPYAASKAAQEMMCIAYWKSYDTPIVITNSNNIVGPNQNPEKFVPKIANQILEGEQVLIHAKRLKGVDNWRSGRRYWNAVENVADALMFILDRKPSKYGTPRMGGPTDRPDRYSLSGGEELDNLQMAQLVAKILGKKLRYKMVDAEKVRKGYDEFYAATVGQLDQLGWVAPYSLEEGLAWLKSK